MKTKQCFTAFLIALFLGMGKAFAAYDFSAVCETGQTLYYHILEGYDHCVELTYPGEGGNYWVGFEKPTGNITLPSQVSYNGINYTVIRIAAAAFMGCTDLTGSLVIPDSVTEIGHNAFRQTGFTGTLTLGSSLSVINNLAFEGCGFTGSLTIPNSVKRIGNNAFSNCTGFTGSLILGEHLFYIGTKAFNNCSGFTGTLTIPNAVTTMGNAAFMDCTGFTQVNYNATNCSDVGYSSTVEYPFKGCVATLTIGDNVERIPSYMFPYANFTGPLTIPDSVTEIGEFAFYSCYGFTGPLTLSNTLTRIEALAFAHCNFTGPLTIPNSVTLIEYQVFYGTAGFTGMLTIGSSVGEIGYQAFYLINHSITAITVLAETPPELENNNVFSLGTHSLPMYVPRTALSSYLENEGWSGYFHNITYPVTVNATVMPSNGGTVSGQGITGYGQELTMTATPSTNYLFLHWKKDGEVVSCNASYTFTPEDDTDLEAVFMGIPFNTKMIGQGETTSLDLPTHSFYYYSMTQQIYTASELGGSRTITSISFYNAGPTKTRSLDIYMTHTSKTNYTNTTDWITVDASKRVFSGTVELKKGEWTTIPLDKSFGYSSTYSGGNNLALIVDDNTGDWNQGLECRTYPVQEYQAIYVHKDDPNINPLSPSSYSGLRLTQKNQIMFNRNTYQVNASAVIASAGTVTGVGQYGQNDFCRLKAIPNEGYVFMDWTDASGTVVSTDAEYVFLVEEDVNLTATFLPEDDYCNITFDLYDSYGDGWNGNYLVADLGFYGLTRRFTVPEDLDEASFALPVLQGSLVTLNWISGSFVSECSFELSYTEGDWIYESIDLGVGYSYIFEVDCGMTDIQTLALTSGINWVSFNVETTLDDLKAALVDALPGSTSINIRSQNSGYSTYNGTRWRGSLNSIDQTQMYMVTVNAPCEIALEGMPIDPDGLPITIKSGNNWMAFPIATSMTLSEAFAGFTVTIGDVIKSQNNGMATYNGTRWRGSLSVLEAGQGYIYNSAATGDKTLVFPTTAK